MDSNNLDKYFREEFNSREVPYRPDDWAEMSDYLDKHPIAYRKKISKRRVLLPIGLLSLLVVGFLLPRNTEIRTSREGSMAETVKLRTIHPSLKATSDLSLKQQVQPKHNSVSIQSADLIGVANNPQSNYSNRSIAQESKEEQGMLLSIAAKPLVESSQAHDYADNSTNFEWADLALQPLNIQPVFSNPNEEQDLDVKSMSLWDKMPTMLNKNNTLELFLGLGFIESPEHPVYRVGISGNVHLNSLFFMRAGLTFSSQHTHPHAGYIFEKKIYYLGVNSTFYEMEVENALSLAIPLDLGLKKGRHSFLAGIELEQILASRGKFVERSPGEAAQFLTEGWIVDSEILPLRWANYAVGYEYMLNPKISLGFRLERALFNTSHLEGDVLRSSPLSSVWGRGAIQLRINI
jgi:hypothetical protein